MRRAGAPAVPIRRTPHGDGSIGAWGYDFREGGALIPPYARDIMSYCGPARWMSDYGFTKALNYRLRTDVGAAAVAQVGAEPPTRTLILWGGVDARGEPSSNRLSCRTPRPQSLGPPVRMNWSAAREAAGSCSR